VSMTDPADRLAPAGRAVAGVNGVLAFTDHLERDAIVAYARRLEELGYEIMLLPDLFGRDLFVLAGYVLGHTTRLRVGTGIAGIYGRDPMAMLHHARTLSELHDGRFLLGLGVSNPMGAALRGQAWTPPLARMRAYLETMRELEAKAPPARHRAPVHLAAHGPKMLALAASHADGANTYLMPPARTTEARTILGPDRTLNVFLPCCLCDDPEQARKTARKALAPYLTIDAYPAQWRKLGFADTDFVDGGSDRLIDTLVARGDAGAIRARIAEHVAAGADHVVVLPYNPVPRDPTIFWPVLEALAPGT